MSQTRQLKIGTLKKQKFFNIRETCETLKEEYASVIAKLMFENELAIFYLISGAEVVNADHLAKFDEALDSLELVSKRISVPPSTPRQQI